MSNPGQVSASKIAELQELVKHKVEHLRPKLLDLTRKNPLLATKLTPRSNAHVRVVDELPDILFYKLNNGQEMRLVPLPDIEDDPKDENAERFRDALSAARLTDESYLSELEAIDRDADDYIDRTRAIERALKDRLRAELGMPARPKHADINLMQHARNNGIAPTYELPRPDEGDRRERHSDDDIQTLLLPKDLERKLNSVTSKCRTWMQETGINVLHVAYGFLEWSEPNQSETSFAPLVLCSARIDKRRTREGAQFFLNGAGEDAETNAVLIEKMRLDFGIELPPFAGTSVEEYMAAIAEIAPKQLVWKVRRQVAIGVFPSARMAMYHDIDPSHPSFPNSEIVTSLLAGANTETASPFADEYNVDEPAIEKCVPYVVMDADSSQFSTLVDIANGKNVAVEGPPGTGKSQTIVNAIAAALASGKKVLFVAEKLAALNVVRSRLEAVGLGEFLLPLQAERSTREQVIGSVRDRVEMRRPGVVKDYEDQLSQYRRTRQQLADYIDLLTTSFGASGMTIHEILSKSIATAPRLDNVSSETIERSDIQDEFLNKAGTGRLVALGEALEKAADQTSAAKGHWRTTALTHADRFTVERACDLAARAAAVFRSLASAREKLVECHISRDASVQMLPDLLEALRGLGRLTGDPQLYLALLQQGAAETVITFLERCDAHARDAEELAKVLRVSADETSLSDLRRCEGICREASFDTLDLQVLQDGLTARREAHARSRAIPVAMAPLLEIAPESDRWDLRTLGKAHEAISKAGREVLSLRNAATIDPAGLPILKKLMSEGRVLHGVRDQLAKLVSIDVEVSAESLAETIAVLRSAGRFAIFSSKFRRARRLALSLVRADRFDKRDAIARLEAFSAYRGRERAFRQNAQAQALFGLHFRGIDTDFELFDALNQYLEFCHALPGPALKGLRNFLREADWDELEAIPCVPQDVEAETLATLQPRLIEAQSEIETQASALGELRQVLALFADPTSINPGDLRDLIDRGSRVLSERKALDGDRVVSSILGEQFAGHRTNPKALKPACQWAAGASPVALAVARVVENGRPEEGIARIEAVLELESRADALMTDLSSVVRIDPTVFLEERDEEAAADALEEASRDSEGLFAFSALATAVEALKETGAEPLVADRLASGHPSGIAKQLEALAVRKLARAVFVDHGRKLSRFSGTRLDELRSTLARQDIEIIRLMQKELRRKLHTEAKPPRGNGVGRKSTWTQMALIENEISKQQRFISVRDLTQRAGRALLELKPCWMMSPLAVAQYVPKGAISFDLCIIDEASQMPPEAAIGALLRCRQTVVVGDTNQLPPSSFFRKMIDEEEADEDDAVLNESILEMANATFRPARRLRWHYRSRHSGLIRFSNSLVYNDDLIVFPSATESMSRMGVEFRKVEGLYKAGTNPIEAREVVSAALEFMRTDPNRSLGIVTLNQKQRDLIAEELEYALTDDRQAQAYIEAWKERNDGLEEFFIKNLENVQGDERDVIFIGTVYGPESQGAKPAQRFGPINGLAGKRRLNVLFSRAKEKIVTFSSMTSGDIVAEEDGNAGAYMLKRWLEYAAVGVLDGGITTLREPDSDFEVYVMDQIRAMGCEPVPQVGVAGYFVDIGVRHPQWPYGFILGVECDGASYHSAKSARDRDRLPQEVLERLGWSFHRIWSTDWFNNPRQEAERLRGVIDQRLAALKAREAEFSVRAHEAEQAVSSAVPESEPEDVELTPVRVEKLAPVQTGELGVAVGDTVRVRYLNGDRSVVVITISPTRSDPKEGLVHHEAPIAKALLGAGEGEEVEVLSGAYVRLAKVESIMRNPG
ncbi:DUF4011 domain-containing protein [Rhodopseudomonas palustris]|uniref:DUF4011 domain-containing protein n=1 Tax=Rhodopseudomonas palustris TaxID=1076 RepID=UPI000CEC7E18|nr:DUF4011 domain-containing protein [Rhodopseudomonas palustris]PPQ44131.1 hypothetical protein CKO39_07810 [Rhodopseudomonas palustris]